MNILVNDLNIRYKISGEGEKTIIILQGWGTECGMYDSITETVKDDYRVIQFDFPGFGESEEPKEGWNVDAYADFFCEFVKKLDVKKAILFGHSYGGRVIIKLAARESIPFEIEKIVLIDSAGILPKKTFLQKVKIKKYKCLKAIYNLGFVHWLFPEIIDDWKSRQGSADYRNASPMMKKCLVLAVNEDLTMLLPEIKAETLLIWGENDTATPLADAKKMDEKIPDSELVVLKNAGHFSFLEQPQVFRNVIKAYLQIGV